MKYLTIDIGGTFVKHSLIDENHKLTQTDKFSTPGSMDDFLTAIKNLISRYGNEISGVCIACPGQVDARTGYLFKGGLISYLKNFPLASCLSKECQLPVSVINDANAAGLAEAKYGNLVGSQLGAALVLGTGVGLALVSNGELLSFKNFERGALFAKAKTDQTDKKELFTLRKKGVASLIENSGSAVQFIHRASNLLGLPQEDGKEVFKILASKTNPDLTTEFENYCREIAYLILNLQKIFNLDRVIIGGGISQQKILIEEINRQHHLLLKTTLSESVQNFSIKAGKFHNDANLIGAYCHFKELG